MSKAKRTSISIEQETLAKGLQRVRELGYNSFSEYLAFLVERDHHEHPDHVTVRAAGRPVESSYSIKARAGGAVAKPLASEGGKIQARPSLPPTPAQVLAARKRDARASGGIPRQ